MASPRTLRRAYLDFYNTPDERRWGREHVPFAIPNGVRNVAGLALEVGCGNGPVELTCAVGMVTDISFPALRKLRHPRRVQSDAQRLPFRSECLEAYITIATLEHVPDPNLALQDMDRALKPGGIAYLRPSWNCRSWTAKGITVSRYRQLPWRLRMLKVAVLLRERLWWRAAVAMPGRVQRELRILLFPWRAMSLDFKQLVPNLDEYLCSDSDAWASIDPHSAITFLRARRYSVLSHPTLTRRLLARHEAVVARKATTDQ